MSPLVQVCIVLVTLGFVAIVVAVLMAMIRLGRAAERLTSTAEVSLAQVEKIAQESRELLESVREILPPAQRAVRQIGDAGARVAGLSHAILDEIEAPVRAAVALSRGVKTGTMFLRNRLAGRFSSTKNGGESHE